jgi:hypothetical protein
MSRPGNGGFWSRFRKRVISSWSMSPAERAGSAASSSRCASVVRSSAAYAMARYNALVNRVSKVPGEEIAVAKCSRAFSGWVGHAMVPSST